MTLNEAYELSARPYLEAQAAVDWHQYINLRAWRYVLEVNSACNLHCTLCHAGNRQGYQSTVGVMKPELMEKILDKIAAENPKAVVCAYVNSDPMLHPDIASVIRSIKGRGLSCEIATNLNIMRDIPGIFAAKPDLFTVSMSGWTQEIYERAHRGGNVDRVKQNIYEMNQIRLAMGYKGFVGISYHFYKDNMGQDQWGQVKEFAKNLGLPVVTSLGRTITMENTIQACRQLELEKTGSVPPYDKGPGDLDLNTDIPQPSLSFMQGIKRLICPPTRAVAMYEKWPVSPVCVISDVFCEIRHDGRVQLCAWTDDERLTIGNYLDLTPDQIREARRGHPICKECLRYRLNIYYHIVDKSFSDWGRVGQNAGLRFKPSALATQLLGGLKGIEIGASAQNPFYLDTLNVDWTDEVDTSWKQEEMKQCGELARVDVIADGAKLPFADNQWDFVVSSQCLEHNWDVIGTLKEWLRVVKPGGLVFTIFPHPERTWDKGRARTPLSELIARHAGELQAPDLTGVVAEPATYQLFHFTVWHLPDALECAKYIGGNEVVATQDPDDKVSNGFTFVLKKL